MPPTDRSHHARECEIQALLVVARYHAPTTIPVLPESFVHHVRKELENEAAWLLHQSYVPAHGMPSIEDALAYKDSEIIVKTPTGRTWHRVEGYGERLRDALLLDSGTVSSIKELHEQGENRIYVLRDDDQLPVAMVVDQNGIVRIDLALGPNNPHYGVPMEEMMSELSCLQTAIQD